MLVQTLVKENIQAGRELLEALKRESIRVTGAFWVRLPDSGSVWRLVIATERARDPLVGYDLLQEVFRKLPPELDLSFTDVSFLHPRDPQYLRLREYALGPGQFGVGAAEASEYRNLVFEDAYVYL